MNMEFDGARLSFFTSAIREIELNRNYIQRFIDERCKIEDRDEIWEYIMLMPQIGIAIANSYKKSNEERTRDMLKEIFKPELTIIFAGIKGGGKTAFLYFCGEEYHRETGKEVCIYNPLNYKQGILPNYFYDAYDESDIRPKSLILFDEAQIFISSRRSMSADNVDFSKFLTIQRHTGYPMITSQQTIAMSEVNTYRLAKNFIFKMIGLLQMERERTRRDPMFIFLDFLRPMNVGETLFMSSDLTKILLAKTPLPSFWSDELSMPARRMKMPEAIETCKKLYEKGLKPDRISFRMDLLGWDWSPVDCLHYATMSKKDSKKFS
jgi:hypothetical protein